MIFGVRDMTKAEFKAWEEEAYKWRPFYSLLPRQLTSGLNKGRWVWFHEIERRQFIGEGGLYSLYRLKGDGDE